MITGDFEARLKLLCNHFSLIFSMEKDHVFFMEPQRPAGPPAQKRFKSSSSSLDVLPVSVPSKPPRAISLEIFSTNSFHRLLKEIVYYKRNKNRKKDKRKGAPAERPGRKPSRCLGFGSFSSSGSATTPSTITTSNSYGDAACDDDNDSFSD